MNQIGRFIWQNMITTFVGLNPGTVMKHGPTAAVLSVREVGAEPFAKSSPRNVRSKKRPVKSNWQFAIRIPCSSAAIRNWAETLYGLRLGLAPGDTGMRQEDHGAILEACGAVGYDIRSADLVGEV